MLNVRVEEIAHLTAEWQTAVTLRQNLLRTPLGLRFSDEELAGEHLPARHFAAYVGGKIIGCAILLPLGDGVGKLRQVAVESGLQGRGVGGTLVSHVESVALGAGVRLLILHARADARGFYAGLGYQCWGPPFTEFGLSHLEMRKDLRPVLES